MAQDEIAHAVLVALGGTSNILTNTVCMTRLRVTLRDLSVVDYESLAEVQGVLGTATRGSNGLEVVFGPRMIDGVYHSFIRLTGIAASSDVLFPMSRPESSMRVQIRTAKKDTSTSEAPDEPLLTDSEISLLDDIFAKVDADQDDYEPERPDVRLAVINGPNINMLGVAAPAGTREDYPGLLELCKDTARAVGFSRCDCYQSNHEGDLVDAVQDAFENYGAIVINPGAYGSSTALRDALRAVAVPAVEVHRHSTASTDEVGSACTQAICGRGNEGYRVAIEELAASLGL